MRGGCIAQSTPFLRRHRAMQNDTDLGGHLDVHVPVQLRADPSVVLDRDVLPPIVVAGVVPVSVAGLAVSVVEGGAGRRRPLGGERRQESELRRDELERRNRQVFQRGRQSTRQRTGQPPPKRRRPRRIRPSGEGEDDVRPLERYPAPRVVVVAIAVAPVEGPQRASQLVTNAGLFRQWFRSTVLATATEHCRCRQRNGDQCRLR